MRRLAMFAAVALCLPTAAEAAERWTFCVAAADGGSEVFISDVFSAEASREKLEAAFKSVVDRLGGAGANAQCPQPREDKTVAVNAQFDAEAFNRKLGANIRAVPASAFPAGWRQSFQAPASRAKRAPKLQDDQPTGSNAKAHRPAQ